MSETYHGCDPAATIIKYLGGARHVSYLVDRSYQGIWRTTQPKSRGGGGGVLSPYVQRTLLDYARLHRISLTATDFYNPTRLRQIMMIPIQPDHCIMCGVGCGEPVPYNKAWWMAGRAARKQYQYYDPHLEARIAEDEFQLRAQLENLRIQKEHLQQLKSEEDKSFEQS